jgi:two-component system cell cycle response regulator
VKVLVAEDSATDRLVLTRALTDLGHEWVAAEDGERAWEMFEQQGAEVVVSDWMMPGIEGDELCRRVRAREGPYAYFILLTSLQDKAHAMRGMEAGADDFLTKPLDRDVLETRLAAASRITGLHRRLAQQQSELESLNRRLFDQARVDPLTEVGNRLRLREDFKALEDRVERYAHAYAVALCDIDRFKAYNDNQGHVAGDEVLRAVAATLVRNSRPGDSVYRYGGEEMLVVLAEQSLDSAVTAAERMRNGVEDLKIAHPGMTEIGAPGLVTISIGVAAGRGPGDGGADRALRGADEALYRAKQDGRNRVAAEE